MAAGEAHHGQANRGALFGTDAVAGAHGRNVEELVCRVEVGGQAPMDAIMSATSRDITAPRRVRFVMRQGRVYRDER